MDDKFGPEESTMLHLAAQQAHPSSVQAIHLFFSFFVICFISFSPDSIEDCAKTWVKFLKFLLTLVFFTFTFSEIELPYLKDPKGFSHAVSLSLNCRRLHAFSMRFQGVFNAF